VAEFKSRRQMEAWLGGQPREAAVVLAARAALRALPLVITAKHLDYTNTLVLPVFRATVISWATAEYPTRQTALGLAGAAATAYAAAVASASATAAAIAAIDAAACVAAARSTKAFDALAAGAASIAAGVRTADAFAAAAAARAAAAAARTAATCPTDSSASISAIRTSAYAAAHAGEAIYAAAYADARNYAITATDSYGNDTARAAAYAGDTAVPHFWSEISIDATRFEEAKAASQIARLPLWSNSEPDELLSLWQELERELLAAKQDWQVWTSWYKDRLNGSVRKDERELAYVRIQEALWDQGPAIVNAEIARQVKRGGVSLLPSA
jgi:hypothetical protein